MPIPINTKITYQEKYKDKDQNDFQVFYWQNHEATKLVILKLKWIDGKTNFKFTLLDKGYCKIAS